MATYRNKHALVYDLRDFVDNSHLSHAAYPSLSTDEITLSVAGVQSATPTKVNSGAIAARAHLTMKSA
jgi:hypothetical protein